MDQPEMMPLVVVELQNQAEWRHPADTQPTANRHPLCRGWSADRHCCMGWSADHRFNVAVVIHSFLVIWSIDTCRLQQWPCNNETVTQIHTLH